ncbi:hypothetical protein HPB50_010044 [Hyalomma asiaticum]|uniref:Uncharacterized protein n=1 Tax=Hyalomma asiaticum TaxID=266040 RepID=A0ACB7RZA8_HYAAI|nr:hypothetical protein HPB50_010044 [Hyalomma asiaticum]
MRRSYSLGSAVAAPDPGGTRSARRGPAGRPTACVDHPPPPPPLRARHDRARDAFLYVYKSKRTAGFVCELRDPFAKASVTTEVDLSASATPPASIARPLFPRPSIERTSSAEVVRTRTDDCDAVYLYSGFHVSPLFLRYDDLVGRLAPTCVQAAS